MISSRLVSTPAASSPPARAPTAARVSRAHACAGFTLLELLAVLLLTAVVLGVALNFFTDLSRATLRATEGTRVVRHATAVLDRVGRDLERTVLVARPPEVDPLNHPWIFLGESKYAEEGSDRLKFIIRGRRSSRSDTPESDLATVSYRLRQDDDGHLALLRWSSPRLPEGFIGEFPPEEEFSLVADDLASFGVRFLSEDGSWADVWDSSQLAESSKLPVAVEIRVALARDGAPETDREEPTVYTKQVVLPVRPLDMVALLDPAQNPSGATGGPGEDSPGGSSGGGSGGASAGNAKQVSTLEDCLSIPVDQIPENLQPYYRGAAKKKITDVLNSGFVSRAYIRPECLR